MEVSDRKDAETQLRRIGYFRLGAYLYPFRQLLSPESVRETSYQYRSENFVPGSNFKQVLELYRFDSALRKVCLEGLQELEISLRAAMSHVLSGQSVFAHLDKNHLDSNFSKQIDPATQKTNFYLWTETYEKARKDSKDEDFVAHHLIKYGNDLPLWMTVEIVTFGGLVRLFNLMKDTDKTAVAKYFGITDGRRMHKWLLAFNGLRNVCAHHHRLWNRQLTYELRIPSQIVDSSLQHLAQMGNSKKIYHAVALLAYLLRKRDCGTQWNLTFKTQMRKFPKDLIKPLPEGSPFADLQKNMGFPKDWEGLDIWNV